MGETTVVSKDFDGVYYRIRTTSFEVRYLISGGDDPERVENVDVTVSMPDGSRWSATMFTVGEVERLMTRWARSGEYGGGTYFWCPDGIIVREPGVSFMTEVLIGLHDGERELTAVLQPLDGR